MKKIAIALVTAAMASAAVLIGGSAQAAYGPSIDTTCSIQSWIIGGVTPGKSGRYVKVDFDIRSNGTAQPRGTIVIHAYDGARHRYDHSYTAGQRYAPFSFDPMKFGRYASSISFYPAEGSSFKPCYMNGPGFTLSR